ncbi:glycosyltransferase family 4 protein [Paenibacillus sp. HB172176]|uniref:glycosyltransferase family 4 protein n=1 Tax=Paenibacillus sp. HB172176 TaxID=2493690 RepID=UPI00143BF7B9|nr:glycosyltransferase family 4 protein [Paenibacillus sp. HB172176]
MSRRDKKLRIGYSSGSARMLNERAIDSKWVHYLGQYAELAPIPPLSLYRMFGGSTKRLLRDWPASLQRLSQELRKLQTQYRIQTLYLNIPALAPYLMMGRAALGIELGFLFIAHSVVSEHWLRQWLAIAPFLNERDVLLCSSESSKEALCRISDRYRMAKVIPLGIELRSSTEVNEAIRQRNGTQVLSIGRLEDVKNIQSLLRIFATVRDRLPEARLAIAGEYTGRSDVQIESYSAQIDQLVERLDLGNHVTFTGPVEGDDKETLFAQSDLLINVSTDPGETFGYNLIEAKTWGVPVICANWNGFREVVADGEDGMLIDCYWDTPYPVVDERQAAEAALSLLADHEARRRMSRKAAEVAQRYDYRGIFPIIAEEMETASAAVWNIEHEDIPGMMLRKLSEQGELYRLDHLRMLPFLEQPLFRILTSPSETPLKQWMPLIKPIAHHYAGRNVHAEH